MEIYRLSIDGARGFAQTIDLMIDRDIYRKD
jgi:hypothetical protein